MSMPKPIANFETYLTAALSPAGTEAYIFDVLDDAGNTLDGKEVWVVIDSERCFGTIDAANKKIDLTLRGVDPNDSTVEEASLKVQHEKGAPVRITDAHYLLQVTEMLSGDISLQGVPKLPTARTISNARQVVDKEYADALTVASFADFATTDAGGLNINVAAGTLVTADGTVEYAGSSGVAMTNNATNYVQLSPEGTLLVNTTGFLVGYMPLSTVVTSGGDITSISLKRGLATIPGGDKNITTDFTYGDTISAGNPVYLDTADGKWKRTSAASSATAAGRVGIALDAGVNNDTGKRVQIDGIVDILSGLTPGYVYLGDATATLSSTPGTFRKAIGRAITATKMVLMDTFQVARLTGANADATTANFNEAMTFFANTDATGVEMETLTAGPTSDATSLHRHEMFTSDARGDYIYGPCFVTVGFTSLFGTDASSGGSVATRPIYSILATPTSSDRAAIYQSTAASSSKNVAPTDYHRANMRIRLTDVSESGIFFGLSSANPDTGSGWDGLGWTAAQSTIGVQMAAGGALTGFASDSTTRATSALGITLAINRWYDIGWQFTSAGVQFYVDGIAVGSPITTNLPTERMDFGAENTNTSTARNLFVASTIDFWIKKT